MSRTPSVLVLAAALAVTPFVYGADAASERTQKREETRQAQAATEPQVPAATPAPITLEQLLPDTAGEPETIETENGVSATVTHLDVVVARIGADGKPVMACVDSKEAARRFSHAPVDKLQTKKAKEQ